MPYLGKSPQHGNYSKIDDFSGDFDGSDATHAVASNGIAITPVRPEGLIISINGVIQEPVTDYTVSGTNITFTTAPASGDSFFGVVMGEQLAIGTPSDATVTSAKLTGNLVTPGTLDVNGQELILDADADTSITADTDDTIDIKIAGADDFQFTANTFTALSGSTIAIASGATIANSGTATGFSASTLDAATTVGDGTAEDTKIVFDGNAQDYYIGLDDTDDDLKIGLGSTVGTTAHIVIDETGAVTKPLQPSLLAVSGAVNNVTGNGDAYTPAAFTTEVFDRNADFDGTGTFTAPVTGVYAVGVTAQLGGMTSSETRARALVAASNRSIDLFDVHGYNGSQPDPKMTMTGYTLVDADASDTIVITIYVFNGSKVVDWKANSTLSIHLVA